MYVCMLEPNLSLCCEIRSMNLMQHVHFIKIKGSSNEFTVMGQRTRHAYDCGFMATFLHQNYVNRMIKILRLSADY